MQIMYRFKKRIAFYNLPSAFNPWDILSRMYKNKGGSNVDRYEM